MAFFISGSLKRSGFIARRIAYVPGVQSLYFAPKVERSIRLSHVRRGIALTSPHVFSNIGEPEAGFPKQIQMDMPSQRNRLMFSGGRLQIMLPTNCMREANKSWQVLQISQLTNCNNRLGLNKRAKSLPNMGCRVHAP